MNTSETFVPPTYFATCSANGKAWYEGATDLVELVKICKANHPNTNVEITDRMGRFVAYLHHTQNHA
jgi:hypothetical protein